MIRLSKKGWNNVLIFSMLIMIMVFNGVHTRFNSSESTNSQVTLLPEDSLVLTLTFPEVKIERIGQGWRTNPAVELSTEQLSQVMADWQQQTAELQLDDNEAKVMTKGKMPAVYVVAELAGKTDGAVYAFYPQLSEVWIHDQQQSRWLKAPITVMSGLIPELLIKNNQSE